MSEVLRYTPVARCAKALTAQRWVPVTLEEVNALAPEIDAAYERAVGLDKWYDPAIEHILRGQIPSVELRLRLARHLVELRRVLDHVGAIDFTLWWSVISEAMEPQPPNRVRLRGANKLPNFYEQFVRFAHA